MPVKYGVADSFLKAKPLIEQRELNQYAIFLQMGHRRPLVETQYFASLCLEEPHRGSISVE